MGVRTEVGARRVFIPPHTVWFLQTAWRLRTLTVLEFTLACVLLGGLLWLGGHIQAASFSWTAATLLGILWLAYAMVGGLRRGRVGVDLIALLALGGSLILQQLLAGSIIALMLATGRALEEYANRRAHRELAALLSRAPRFAHRYEGEELTTIVIHEVKVGDRLVVKPGEVVPVDGRVSGAAAVLDESAVTGESLPVEHAQGDRVVSGTVNAGGMLELRAEETAAQSTYSGIVRLVREAQASRAPFVRLADRYALFFLPLTLAISGGAWLVSGDPIRALAVLVVATPCPLILAAPVAIVAGMSRAAVRGIIIKGGGALETLARPSSMLFDKTGTLTRGVPALRSVHSSGHLLPDELLTLAGSLEQSSTHVLAATLVHAARQRGLALQLPRGVSEEAGKGIRGWVGGRPVALGKADWVGDSGRAEAWVDEVKGEAAQTGSSNVFISVDRSLEGAFLVADPLREEAAATIQALRRKGARRILMLTGDHRRVGERVAAELGLDGALTDLSPEGKIVAVKSERRLHPTIMVGDGINDAPALAAADVGVAMGARGATASSEVADVVVLVDRLDRLVDGIAIARRARAIALESVLVGMGLSLLAMLVAAAGLLAPVPGALVQEGIDVAVILNALRALTGHNPSVESGPGPAGPGETARGEESALAFRAST